MRGWKGGWIALLLGWGWVFVVQAASLTQCPLSFPVIPPASTELRQQALADLEGLEDPCRERADFFAWQGTLLLVLHHPQKAANALEKALMLDPELAGAQLDYAQALAELGEKEAAKDLTLTVLGRVDIPQTLHDWLADQPGLWNEGVWQTTWTVQSMLGHETNFNSAPSSNLVTLTLLGGNVPVTLGQSQQPEAGFAMLTTGAVETVRHWSDSQLQLEADATNRTSQDHADSNLQWIDGSALWSHNLGDGTAGAQAYTTRLRMGGQVLYEENTGKLFVDHPLNWTGLECRYGSGAEYSLRDYPTDSTLNGVYTGLELGMGCQRGQTMVTATGMWGVDHAQNPLRLGGDQSRDDFSLTASQPLGQGLLILLGQWSRLSDQEVYSPLLGGMVRGIIRRGGRIEYDYPLNKHWTVLGYLDTLTQDSNISLFTLSNQALYFGLRWGGN